MNRPCQAGVSEGCPPGSAHTRQSRPTCSLDGRWKYTALPRQPRKAGAHAPPTQLPAIQRIYNGTTMLDRLPPSGHQAAQPGTQAQGLAGGLPPEGGEGAAQGKPSRIGQQPTPTCVNCSAASRSGPPRHRLGVRQGWVPSWGWCRGRPVLTQWRGVLGGQAAARLGLLELEPHCPHQICPGPYPAQGRQNRGRISPPNSFFLQASPLRGRPLCSPRYPSQKPVGPPGATLPRHQY